APARPRHRPRPGLLSRLPLDAREAPVSRLGPIGRAVLALLLVPALYLICRASGLPLPAPDLPGLASPEPESILTDSLTTRAAPRPRRHAGIPRRPGPPGGTAAGARVAHGLAAGGAAASERPVDRPGRAARRGLPAERPAASGSARGAGRRPAASLTISSP